MVAPLSVVPLATRVRSWTWVQSLAQRGLPWSGPFPSRRVRCFSSHVLRVRLTKGAAQSGLPFQRSYRVKPGGGRASLSLDDWGRGLLLGG